MRTIRAAVASLVVLLGCTYQPTSPVPARGAAGGFAQLRILVTGTDGNVYLLDGNGSKLRQVTSHANATLYYPSYSWSPDHRYALLVRTATNQANDAVLLLNSSGSPASTILKGYSELSASWALDTDSVAYLAGDQPKTQCPGSWDGVCDTLEIRQVDLNGKALGALWTRTFDASQGCGNPVIAAPALAQRIEDSIYPRNIQWTSSGRLAVVDDSNQCPGWTALLDRSAGTVYDWLDNNLRFCGHSGSTKSLSPPLGGRLQLSPSGTMYVAETSSAQTPEIVVCSERGTQITTLPGRAPGWWNDSNSLYYSNCQAGKCAIFLVDLKKLQYGRISNWESAYAFGPMQPVSGALIFSRIEALKGGRSRVTIQRFDTNGYTTISTWASRPVA